MIPLGVIQQQAVSAGLSCAYPLDDDGTTAASFGAGYAGPAVAPAQQGLSFTSTGSDYSVLVPAGAMSSARFLRPASGSTVVEFNYAGGTVEYASLLIIISNAAGSLINAAQSGASVVTAGVRAVTVASDGTIAGFNNGSSVTLAWSNNAGQKTVGATDKVSYGIFVQPSASGQTAAGTLRTRAADMTGTYIAGETDPCGTVI